MKIIYGAVKPDAGDALERSAGAIANPQQARRLGIAMVFQHFSLFDTLTVAENVWLGLDKGAAAGRASASTRPPPPTGWRSTPARRCTLSVGEMQRVEIIRALLTRAAPADPGRADLGADAAGGGQTVRHPAPAGRRRLLHPLHQPQAARDPRLCTACTVMRGGKVTGVRPAPGEQRLAVAPDDRRRAARLARPPAGPGRGGAGGRAAGSEAQSPFGVHLVDLSLQVRAGEVVGIAGVSGNGQRELLFALSGEDRRAQQAMVIADQAAGRLRRPRRRSACTSCRKSAWAAARCPR